MSSKLGALVNTIGDSVKPQVGDRVLVGCLRLPGVVKFVGPTEFSSGDWIGLALNEPLGKNDGCVKGVRYFTCESNYGLFVRPPAIVREGKRAINEAGIDEQEQSHTPINGEPNGAKLSASEKVKTKPLSSPQPQPVTKTEPPQKSTQPPPTTPMVQPLAHLTLKTAQPSQPSSPSKAVGQQAQPAAAQNPPPMSPLPRQQSPSDPPEAPGLVSPAEMAMLQPARSENAPDPERISRVQRELAEAMEDRDIDRLRHVLPAAADVGVERKELDTGMKVLRYEVQRSLCQEVEDIRSMISQLADSVAVVEARSKEAELVGVSAASVGRTPSTPPPAVTFSTASPAVEEAPQVWIEQVGEKLVEHVWAGLQPRIEKEVRNAVSQATQALLEAVDEIREASGDVERKRENKIRVRIKLGQCEAATRIQARHRGNRARARLRMNGQFRNEEKLDPRSIVRWWLESAVANFKCRKDTLETPRSHLEVLRRELFAFDEAKVTGDEKVETKLDLHEEERAATEVGALYRGQVAQAKRLESRIEDEHSKAAVVLQKTARCLHARKKYEKSTFGRCVSAVRRRHAVWSLIFDKVAEGAENLGPLGFRKAFQEVIPRASDSQAQAVWTGYTAGTGLIGVDFQGLATILEAASIGDAVICEYADMCVEDYAALAEEATDTAEVDAYVGELCDDEWRKLRPDFASHWDEARVDTPSLCHEGFKQAVFRAHPQLSCGQVYALWSGFFRGTGRNEVRLSEFCAAMEAVEMGDHVVAEYADMSGEVFTMLGVNGGAGAATKLQARHRGRQTRKMLSKRQLNLENMDNATVHARAVIRIQKLFRRWAERKATIQTLDGHGLDRFHRYALLMTKKHRGTVRIFDLALAEQGGDSRYLQAHAFERALFEIHSRLSRAQIHALYKGTTEGRNLEDVDIKTFCSVVDAVATGDGMASEFADMLPEDFKLLRDDVPG